MATRVLDALAAPFDLDDTQVFVRASIGISVAIPGQRGPDAVEALLRNADVAMYSAKNEGGGRWRLFEPAMHDAARQRLELKSALDGALERDELILNFQPILDLGSGAVCGVEALVRWAHPEQGIIAPLDFIPLAEETGQIVPIGDWVLNEACRVAVQLQRSHPSAPIYMAVNLACLLFYAREHRSEFNVFLHAVIPILGILAFVLATRPTGGPSAPGKVVVAFESEAPGEVALAYTPGEPGALLWATGLPDPGPGKVYEVWMIEDERPVRGACLAPDDGAVAAYLDADLTSGPLMASGMFAASTRSASAVQRSSRSRSSVSCARASASRISARWMARSASTAGGRGS